MTTDPLRTGTRDDVRTELQGTTGVSTHSEGVVDNKRHLKLLANRHDSLEIGNVVRRIRQGLVVHGFRVLVGLRLDLLGLGTVDELDVHTHARERVLELSVRTTVKIRSRNDVVTLLTDRKDRMHLSSLSGSRDQGVGMSPVQKTGRTLQLGNTILKHMSRRIHDSRVDRSELFQRKQIRTVSCVLERERGGGVDGRRSGSVIGIHLVSVMKHHGIETFTGFAVGVVSEVLELL